MMTRFDHLVIGAADLDQGAAWARETLGAQVPAGGAHPLMGTHNLLARLPAGYLEIIAADPAAADPGRARWYSLDDPATRAAIAERPRPIAWVLAVDDLDAAAARAAWNVGEILTATRGDLTWRISVPADGSVVEGVLPTLIEWPESLGRNAPTSRMADLGLAMRSLRLETPTPARIRDALASLDAAEAMAAAGVALSVVEAAVPGLEAMFTSPRVRMSL